MDPALVTAQQRELRHLILQCLGRFDATGREPDLWESIHLMNAIKALDAGAGVAHLRRGACGPCMRCRARPSRRSTVIEFSLEHYDVEVQAQGQPATVHHLHA